MITRFPHTEEKDGKTYFNKETESGKFTYEYEKFGNDITFRPTPEAILSHF